MSDTTFTCVARDKDGDNACKHYPRTEIPKGQEAWVMLDVYGTQALTAYHQDCVTGLHYVTRDGVKVSPYFPEQDHAYKWLQQHQGQSADRAMQYEGWGLGIADGALTEKPTKALTREQSLVLMEHLDRGTNLFGKLSPEIRSRLYAVAENPNEITWSDAHIIVVNGDSFVTLWEACMKHAGYAVTSKPLGGLWPEIPSTTQILTALQEELGVKRTWAADGPVRPDDGVVGGDGAGQAFSVRYTRADIPGAIITSYWYPVDESERYGDDPIDPDARTGFNVENMVECLICTDPADPGGTEVWSHYDYRNPAWMVFKTEAEAVAVAERSANSELADQASSERGGWGWNGEATI